MALRRQSRVRGGGARRVEFSKFGHLGQQTRRSLRADAGDRIKQLSLSLESWVVIEVPVDLHFDIGDPLIERVKDFFPRLADSLGQASLAEPVTYLCALIDQIIKVTNERLQFLMLRLRRCPQRWIVTPGKTRDQHAISAIGLVALQFALAKGLDLRGVYNADLMPGGVKIFGQGIAISASGFHHGMDLFHAVFGKPTLQILKTGSGIGELALFSLHGFRIANQRHIKGLFANVNSEFWHCYY